MKGKIIILVLFLIFVGVLGFYFKDIANVFGFNFGNTNKQENIENINQEDISEEDVTQYQEELEEENRRACGEFENYRWDEVTKECLKIEKENVSDEGGNKKENGNEEGGNEVSQNDETNTEVTEGERDEESGNENKEEDAQEKQVYDQNSWKDMLPKECKSFFDGCNSCMVQENEMVTCTMKACKEYAKPKCLDGTTDEDFSHTTVNVPLIYGKGKIGCGVGVKFAPYKVPKTKGVLDATYKKLFELSETDLEKDHRNTLKGYEDLKYKTVTVKDRTARVYLTGNMNGPDHCALPEIRAQIDKAALQFKTVDTVVVYLNDKIYNWCEKDLSDGESGCPEKPQYWIDN
ncbi:hypothetical protein CSB11_01050 [Candidatus Campbellbacteria bacterium]|nr:MAG: hypothetical protein CSB11_01050 [Candidatus Campbellbacteria bacterium]